MQSFGTSGVEPSGSATTLKNERTVTTLQISYSKKTVLEDKILNISHMNVLECDENTATKCINTSQHVETLRNDKAKSDRNRIRFHVALPIWF
jgi:hypothetical protein